MGLRTTPGRVSTALKDGFLTAVTGSRPLGKTSFWAEEAISEGLREAEEGCVTCGLLTVLNKESQSPFKKEEKH